MKPTEHKPPLEKELIAHMRESLVEHEESYKLGAWENFSLTEKKRRPIFWWPLMQGVAAVFVAGIILFFVFNPNPTAEQVAKAKVKKHSPEVKDSLQNNDAIAKYEHHKTKRQTETPSFTGSPNVTAKKVPALTAHVNSELTLQKDRALVFKDLTLIPQQQPIGGSASERLVISKETDIVKLNSPAPEKTNMIEFLTNESKKNKVTDSENNADQKKNKFTVGLVVAPSFGNVKKLNMGYGVSLDYSLSDKFSLNSGIAYNEMAASKATQQDMSFADAPMASAIAKSGTSKSLQSVEERVTGIDIPLELKYHLSKSFYANVGVSAFAVINQQRNNTYLEEKIVPQSSTTGTFSNVLISERVTEQEAQTVAKDYSYLGFYNLSLGYRKKVSKHNSFAVEPFLKLPMRDIKAENLKLIGAGVKLKFDF